MRNVAIIGAIVSYVEKSFYHTIFHTLRGDKNIHGKNGFVDLKIIFFGHSNLVAGILELFASLSTFKLLHNYFNNFHRTILSKYLKISKNR